MIKLVITDLDNTLYNWVDYFVPAFNAMVQELVRLTNVDEKALKESFKRVYRRHGTTEYSFAIEELDILVDQNAGRTVAEILAKYDSAIKAFRTARRKTLRLYESVASTLQELRQGGRKVAAHTDAMMFYAEMRLKELGIEGLFDALVAPRDHGLPPGARLDDVRQQGAEDYKAQIGLKRALKPGVVKPNPECLLDIVRTFGVTPDQTVYVGDSLHKDIRMARECGVHDVYAVYGRQVNSENYRQLVEITHWTEEDVLRERDLRLVTVEPQFTIGRFSELLEVIEIIERGK